jgi:hypothetical protein
MKSMIYNGNMGEYISLKNDWDGSFSDRLTLLMFRTSKFPGKSG